MIVNRLQRPEKKIPVFQVTLEKKNWVGRKEKLFFKIFFYFLN